LAPVWRLNFFALWALCFARASLAILCAAFVVGRVSHAVGLSMKNTFNPARVGGIVLTAIVGMGLGWRLVSSAISHLLS